MVTEKEIIYSILNTVRNGQHNSDETITERLLRAYLSNYRADAIRKNYENGLSISDEVFQQIEISLEEKEENYFVGDLPKYIHLDENGYYLFKNLTSIPIVNKEKFELFHKNNLEKSKVNAYITGNKLTVYGGTYEEGLDENNDVVLQIISEKYESQNSNKKKIVAFEFSSVLQNPSDDKNYDWERDPYPFPAERIPELRYQIIKNEFGIMAEAKTDEVQNARKDNIRYHEEQKLE